MSSQGPTSTSEAAAAAAAARRISGKRMPPPPKQYSLRSSRGHSDNGGGFGDGREEGASFHRSSSSLYDDDIIDQSVSSQISRDASELVHYIRDDGDKEDNSDGLLDFSSFQNEDSIREQMRIMEEIEQRRKSQMEASGLLSTSIAEADYSFHEPTDPDTTTTATAQNGTSGAIDVKKDQQAILENILKASSSSLDIASLSATPGPNALPSFTAAAASASASAGNSTSMASASGVAMAQGDLHHNDEETEAAAAAAAAALGQDQATIREEQAKILAQIERQITGESASGDVPPSRRRSVLEISMLSRNGLLQLDDADGATDSESNLDGTAVSSSTRSPTAASTTAAAAAAAAVASASSSNLPEDSINAQSLASLEPTTNSGAKSPDQSEQFLIEQKIILSQIEKKEENPPSNNNQRNSEEELTDDLARALGTDASRSQQLLLEQEMIFRQLRRNSNDNIDNTDDNNDGGSSTSAMNWANMANEMGGSSSSLPLEDLSRVVSPPSDDRFSASAHVLGTTPQASSTNGDQLREQMEILDAIRRDRRRGQSQGTLDDNRPPIPENGEDEEDPEIREQREILESIQRRRQQENEASQSLSMGYDNDDKGDEDEHDAINRQIQEQVEAEARNLSLAEREGNLDNINSVGRANHISESSLPMLHIGHESYDEIEEDLDGSERVAQHIISPSSYREEPDSRALLNAASSTGSESHPDSHARIIEVNSEPVGNDGPALQGVVEATVLPSDEAERRAASQWTPDAEEEGGMGGNSTNQHDARDGDSSGDDGLIGCTYTGGYNGVGERHGHGTLTWTNGDRYEGDFCNGMIHGSGALYFSDGSDYEGSWKFNKMHGQGTRRFANGNVYIGNYANGKRFGKGQCFYANGDQYHGEWKDDKFHGFGRYYYRNRDSFEGTYYNGQREGPGKYQLSDGRVDIIRYSANERVGEGVRWSANRKKAWKLDGRRVLGKISLDRAARVSEQIDRGSGSTPNVELPPTTTPGPSR